MSARFRLAPVLANVPRGALFRGAASVLAPAGATDHLTAELQALFPASAVFLYETGRSALAEAMRVAAQATGRPGVVLPAYTSFSVAAAAVAAAVEPVLCDMNPGTLGLDRDALRASVDGRTGAVLLGNLFGWPECTTDLGWLADRGVLLIDDAAQALGAREGRRLAGSRGALGVLSFGRGKCVTLGDGGALLVHDPALVRFVRRIPGVAGRGLKPLLFAVAVSLSRRRPIFDALSRLPGSRIGESAYHPEVVMRAAPVSVRAMAVGLQSAVEQGLAERRATASAWRAALEPVRALGQPPFPAEGEPAYLRYPVLAARGEDRDAVTSALATAGMPYVRSYPTSLGAIEAFRGHLGDPKPTPGADDLARRIVALPCHGSVRREDVQFAAAIMARVPATTAGGHRYPD